MLNAKEHEREAEIIKDAGQPGAVTIATNMAGRGVDIKLGEGVARARRPLRPRAPSATRRAASTTSSAAAPAVRATRARRASTSPAQDDLVRLFAGDRIHRSWSASSCRTTSRWRPEILSRQIENAQKKVEEQNFVARKNVLKYDDVMNMQRQVIYEQRRRVLEGDDLSEDVRGWIEEVISVNVANSTEGEFTEEWDLDAARRSRCRRCTAPTSPPRSCRRRSSSTARRSSRSSSRTRSRPTTRRSSDLGPELMRDLERYVILQVVDTRWREHLDDMDYLREGIHLRGMAQKDPLVEYRAEGHLMFEELEPHDPRGGRADALPRADRGAASPQLERASRRATATCSTSTTPQRAPTRSPPPVRARHRSATALRRTDRDAWRRRGPSSTTRTRTSAATTRAGAGAARSSRSVTARRRDRDQRPTRPAARGDQSPACLGS